MPNATFAADFTSFVSATERAETKLADFARGAGSVQTSLQRMTDGFSGVKIVQEAAKMAEAIERAGGTSVLTAKELESAGLQAQEAAEKMSRLGLDVPPLISALAQSVEKVNPPIEGLGARITGIVAASAAAKTSIEGLIAVTSGWVDASNEQENASVRLESALRAQGSFTPQLAAQYDALATSFEQTTVFSDDLITEMEALLTTVGGVLPQNMNAALKASTDLAAALRIDLPEATNLVAKALEGNTSALKRHGIEIDAVAFQTQGATAVFDAIAEKMGGAATAQAATFGGEMKRLGNTVNNVEEQLGGFVARGLQPMIDAFQSMPASVQTGVIAFGLLLSGAAALATAVAGVGAAVALAAPLLGFTAAGAGAAALAAAGTAAAGLAATLGPVAVAIGLVAAAWKIGELEGVKNTIAEWTLRLQGMTAEQARSAVAATAAAVAQVALTASIAAAGPAAAAATIAHASYVDTLAATTVQVAALSEADKAEIQAGIVLGALQGDLEKQFHLTAAGIEILKKELQETETATKKHKDALEELNSAGDGWLGTLKTMTAAEVTEIETALKAGVSQGALAEAYGKTATQIRAAQKDLDVQAKSLALVSASALAAAQAYDALNKTKLDDQLAQLATAEKNDEKYYAGLLARGKLTEAQYASYVVSGRQQLAQQQETIYRQEADNEKAILDQKQATEAAAVRAQYDQGQISYEAYQIALTNIAAKYAALRDQSDEQYAEAQKKRQQDLLNALSQTPTPKQKSGQDGGDPNDPNKIGPKYTTSYDLSTQEGIDTFLKENQAATLSAGPDYFKTHSIDDAVRAGLLDFYGLLRKTGGWQNYAVIPHVPLFAGGVNNFGGGPAIVGEDGPELLNLPRGSSITPNGKFGSGGDIYLSMNVSGVWDPRTIDDMTDRVSARLFTKTGRKVTNR